jgi:hypothetical protein
MEDPFAEKLLAMMRKEFGGHGVLSERVPPPAPPAADKE